MHEAVDPVHREFPEIERHEEHQPHEECEYREPEHPIGQHVVYPVGTGLVALPLTVDRFTDDARNETVPVVYDDRLDVLAENREQVAAALAELPEDGCARSGHPLHVLLDALVFLKQLNGQPPGGVLFEEFVGEGVVALDGHGQLGNLFLDLPPVNDLDAAEPDLAPDGLSDHFPDLVGPPVAHPDHRHNRDAEQFGKQVDVNLDAPALRRIHHVEGDDERHSQLEQLGGQVEVSFDVAGIDDVDDGVGLLSGDEVPDHHFLERVSRETVCAGKVDDVEFDPAPAAGTFFLLDRHTGPVAAVLAAPSEVVEDGGLAGVGIPGESDNVIHRRGRHRYRPSLPASASPPAEHVRSGCTMILAAIARAIASLVSLTATMTGPVVSLRSSLTGAPGTRPIA